MLNDDWKSTVPYRNGHSSVVLHRLFALARSLERVKYDSFRRAMADVYWPKQSENGDDYLIRFMDSDDPKYLSWLFDDCWLNHDTWAKDMSYRIYWLLSEFDIPKEWDNCPLEVPRWRYLTKQYSFRVIYESAVSFIEALKQLDRDHSNDNKLEDIAEWTLSTV